MGCACLLSQQELNSKNNRIDELTNQIKHFDGQIATSRDSLANKQSKNSQLKKSRTLIQQSFKQSLNVQVKSLNQRSKLTNNLKQLQNKKLVNCQQIQRLQNYINKSQKDVQQIQLEITKTQDYINNKNQLLLAQQKSIELRQKNIIQLKNKIQTKKKQKQQLEQDIKNMQLQRKQLRDLEANISKLQREKQLNQEKLDYFDKNKTDIYLKLNISGTNKKITLFKNNDVIKLKRILLRQFWTQHSNLLIALSFNGMLLQDFQKIPDTNNQSRIVVRKAEVWEIQGIISEKDKVDEISQTKGVAYTPCRHYLSRQTMQQIIHFQIKIQKMHEIRCPFQPSGEPRCDKILEANFCMLVAGLSNTESNELSSQMSINWSQKNGKRCPFCLSMLTNIDKQAKKVKCSACKKNFCSKCQQQMRKQIQLCLSKKCMLNYQQDKILLIKAPKTRVFQMYTKPNNDKYFKVYVPNMRACPRCRTLIMNVKSCKHTPCSCTKDQTYSFCFVCLSLSVKDQFTCGDSFQYCGKVAPNA